MERDLFLRKYRIEQEDFDAAGVSWEELTAIADHYATIEGKLREAGSLASFHCHQLLFTEGSLFPWRNLPSWELIITGNT